MITTFQYTDCDQKSRKPGVWRPNGRLMPVLKDRRRQRAKLGLKHPPFVPKKKGEK